MFYKPFYLIFIFISALLFSAQKSSGNTDLVNFNKFEHITKTPKNAPHQIINDLLVNLDDDDDEASSKTKYRLSKGIVFLNYKYNYSKQDLTTIGILPAHLIYHATSQKPGYFLFINASIYITKRCLRI